MARLPYPLDTLSVDAKRIYEHIAAKRGAVRGPFAPLMHHPALAEKVADVGEYLRFGSTLPGDIRELAILITARAVSAGRVVRPCADRAARGPARRRRRARAHAGGPHDLAGALPSPGPPRPARPRLRVHSECAPGGRSAGAGDNRAGRAGGPCRTLPADRRRAQRVRRGAAGRSARAVLVTWGAPKWPPTPPNVRGTPGDPGRPSITPQNVRGTPGDPGRPSITPNVRGTPGDPGRPSITPNVRGTPVRRPAGGARRERRRHRRTPRRRPPGRASFPTRVRPRAGRRSATVSAAPRARR